MATKNFSQIIFTFWIFFSFPQVGFALDSDVEIQKLLESVQSITIPDEGHGEKSQLLHELYVIEKIKSLDREFNCLFLEIEPKATVAIEKFVNGVDYDDSVRLWISDSSTRLGISFLNIIPDWYLLKAHRLGYKILGADVDWSSELGLKMISLIKLQSKTSEPVDQYGKFIVGERSRIIAANVIRGLHSKTCIKAVLVVGEGHLQEYYKPVQNYFMEANITGAVWK